MSGSNMWMGTASTIKAGWVEDVLGYVTPYVSKVNHQKCWAPPP
jgi:hypothetical protein